MSDRSQRKFLRRALAVLAGFSFVGLFLKLSFYNGEPAAVLSNVEPKTRDRKTLVVSSMKDDDTSWIPKYLPDWELARYIVNDPSAQNAVPKNKGREAMVFLTYMIDNYNNLPELTVFLHSGRYQWHNDDPIYDGALMLQNLQIPYLLTSGYTNIRCVWTLGCPSELTNLDQPKEPDETSQISAKNTQYHYADAFRALFPGAVVPPTVAVACCAQFAVTRDIIRQRPIEDYHRFRNWLLETPLDDSVSGRVLEYTWHMIFGKAAVHCPDAKTCYCNLYGLCDLECEQNKCGERWAYPPYATLPKGWPSVGWNGEVRSEEELAGMRFIAMKAGNGTV